MVNNLRLAEPDLSSWAFASRSKLTYYYYKTNVENTLFMLAFIYDISILFAHFVSATILMYIGTYDLKTFKIHIAAVDPESENKQDNIY